jgi:hypothetical protein
MLSLSMVALFFLAIATPTLLTLWMHWRKRGQFGRGGDGSTADSDGWSDGGPTAGAAAMAGIDPARARG